MFYKQEHQASSGKVSYKGTLNELCPLQVDEELSTQS
jgi:hypothetical protein